LRANTFILATGGILGGGVRVTSNHEIVETVSDLPVNVETAPQKWFSRDFLVSHPIFRSGIIVNSNLKPIRSDNQEIFSNLMVVGSNLGNGDFIQERSYDGIALSSGYMAGNLA
jgi:glycerol-3-phosphate dehydrogenase subunit B